MLTLTIFIVALALLFDFVNGMNDAANSIATIVSTRVLSPRLAVAWADYVVPVTIYPTYAEIYVEGNGSATTIGTQNQWEQFLFFDTNGFTFDDIGAEYDRPDIERTEERQVDRMPDHYIDTNCV